MLNIIKLKFIKYSKPVKDDFFYLISLFKKIIFKPKLFLIFFLISIIIFLYIFSYFIFFTFFIYLLFLSFFLYKNFTNQYYEFNFYKIYNFFKPNLNSYKYFFFVYLIQQPVVYSYILFYFTLFFIFKKRTLKLDLDVVLIKTTNIFYRFLIRLITGVPYFIIIKSLEITLKFYSLYNYNYESKLAYVNTCIINLSLMFSTDLNFCLDSKIIINSINNIYLNPNSTDFNPKFAHILLNLYKSIYKNSEFMYGKPIFNNYLDAEKSRNFIFMPFKEKVNIEEKNSICASTSLHNQMKSKLKLWYGDNFFKTYWDLYHKGEAFDKIKVTSSQEFKEQWTTYPYLMDKRDVIIADPMKAEINQNLFFEKPEIKIPIVKSIVYGITKILPVYDNGDIKLDYNKNIFLNYSKESEFKIFDDDLLNNYLKDFWNFRAQFLIECSENTILNSYAEFEKLFLYHLDAITVDEKNEIILNNFSEKKELLG